MFQRIPGDRAAPARTVFLKRKRTLADRLEVPDLLIGSSTTRAHAGHRPGVTRPMHHHDLLLDIEQCGRVASNVLGQRRNSRNRRAASGLRTASECIPRSSILAAAKTLAELLRGVRSSRSARAVSSTRLLPASRTLCWTRLFRLWKLTITARFYRPKPGRMSALPIDPQMLDKGRRRNRRLRVGSWTSRSFDYSRSIHTRNGDAMFSKLVQSLRPEGSVLLTVTSLQDESDSASRNPTS